MLMNPILGVLSGGNASVQAVMNNEMTMGERALYALQMTAVGLLTVFAVLAIIYVVMLLFRLFFYEIPRKHTEMKPAPTPVPPDTVERKAEPEPKPEQEPEEDDTLIAVLSAAVAAVLAEEAEDAGEMPPTFRVVSFRRKESTRAWNAKS